MLHRVHGAKMEVSGEFPLDFLSTNFTTSLLQSTNTLVAVGIKVKMMPNRAVFFFRPGILTALCSLIVDWVGVGEAGGDSSAISAILPLWKFGAVC